MVSILATFLEFNFENNGDKNNVPYKVCFLFFFSILKGKAIYIFNSYFFQRLKRFESTAPEKILDSVCQVIN